jgi:transposase InsO family protein
VEGLMRVEGLAGAIRGATTRTTKADPAAARPEDLVDRKFNAQRPDELWVVDFTYGATWPGFVYVAFCIDVYSRLITGWRCSASVNTDLPPRRAGDGDLAAAADRTLDPQRLVHHSDAGSQGGFNWSSQHLDRGGVDGQAGGMDAGVDRQGGDDVAGQAVAAA